MNLKRLLLLAVFAFIVYYVLRSPDTAAEAFKGAGAMVGKGMKQAAESLARFIDALFT